ncbi:hypothetical protein VSH64_39510 [Amycolatopsis rhabdoformis]|uniref:DUF222 domain-containing protein n=1 Tax=Amycolatopsis rhabdoformis TaxID=1448059 RepID=A0ABZ1I5D9_9PSEU|nr:hypothetical protein [Amycolatopsis rhabdoformis]WSE28855.1 hypothetical protein VSH64_39510 [Amycolatopsis rhabdoformis]
MTKPQNALDAVEAALAAIDSEIAAKAAQDTIGGQLLYFRAHLEAIKDQIASGTVPPRGHRRSGMAHAIVDSWPIDSRLGATLLEAERRYLDL